MASLLPNGKQQFIDGNGVPLAGGSVAFYIPNTSTYKNTWSNYTLTTLNTNPITLDGDGEAVIWGIGQYRQVVKDSSGNTVWDQVTSGGAVGSGVLWCGTSTGGSNAYAVTAPTDATSYSAPMILQFVANFTNTGPCTITVANENGTSLGSANIYRQLAQGPAACLDSEIVSGSVVQLAWDGTEFQIQSPIANVGCYTDAIGYSTSGTVLTAAEYGRYIELSGAIGVTLPPHRPGAVISLQNVGLTGTQTIFAASGDNIYGPLADANGLPSMLLYPNQSVRLESDGAWWSANAGTNNLLNPLFPNIVTYTTSTTWTVPNGVNQVMAVLQAGGGGGGGALGGASADCYAGGGEAGEAIVVFIGGLAGGQSIAIGVGGAGVGGAATGANGTAGGNSSFASLSALGGLGGIGCTSSIYDFTQGTKYATFGGGVNNPNNGGSLAESATIHPVSFSKEQGGCGTARGYSGAGASSLLGQGGEGVNAQNAGGNATGYGGGGGGACSTSTTGEAGGNGTAGYVIIRY